MKIKSTYYQLSLCCQELGLKYNSGKKVVSEVIREKTGMSGNKDQLIIAYASSLTNKGVTKRNSKQKTARINHSSKMLSIGKRLAEKNVQKNETAAVRRMEEILQGLELPYIREKPVTYRFSKKITGVKIYILDFHIPKPINCIIEVDGSFHIGREEYDRLRDRRMSDKGLGSTLRVSNSEVMRPDFDLIKIMKRMRWVGPRLVEYLKKKKLTNT